MQQFTKEQAIAIAEGGEWKDWTHEEIVKFQMFQDRLCVPFSMFHEATEKVLGRPVYTHEFGIRGHLQAEYLGEKEAPAFDDILEMIPEEKRIVLFVEE